MQRSPQLIAPQFGTGHQFAGLEKPLEPPPRTDTGRTQHLHPCCGMQHGADRERFLQVCSTPGTPNLGGYHRGKPSQDYAGLC